MPLENGLYKISTTNAKGPVYAAMATGPVSAGNPIFGGQKHFAVLVNLEHLEGDQYRFRLRYHPDLEIGYDEDNVKPKAGVIISEKTESGWAVEPGTGEGLYHIHIKNSDLHWSLPPTASQSTPITVKRFKDISTQEWRLKPVKN